MPSFLEYIEKTGELPKCLTMSLAAYIAFYSSNLQGLDEKGLHAMRPKGNEYIINDDRPVLEFYWNHRNDSPEDLVKAVLGNTDMWGQDLNQVPGLTEATIQNLNLIRDKGAKAAFASCL